MSTGYLLTSRGVFVDHKTAGWGTGLVFRRGFWLRGVDRRVRMCVGIALAWSELPAGLVERYDLARRVHARGGEREIQFLYRDRQPRLPVWRDGQLQVVRWGNGLGQSRFLPPTGWTWRETIDSGGWQGVDAVAVDIPATLGLERGIWYRVRQGIRGLLVPDENGVAVVYMICEPSTHYYRVMTRSNRMPVLIEEQI